MYVWYAVVLLFTERVRVTKREGKRERERVEGLDNVDEWTMLC
jgi:hypothetical protein